MRMMIVNALKELGFQDITEVGHGADAYYALTLALKQKPFQLVFSDQNMPMLTGMELLEKIQANAELKNIPFIMITSETPKVLIMKLMAEGAANYIAKPFNVETIRKKLEMTYERAQRTQRAKMAQ